MFEELLPSNRSLIFSSRCLRSYCRRSCSITCSWSFLKVLGVLVVEKRSEFPLSLEVELPATGPEASKSFSRFRACSSLLRCGSSEVVRVDHRSGTHRGPFLQAPLRDCSPQQCRSCGTGAPSFVPRQAGVLFTGPRECLPPVLEGVSHLFLQRFDIASSVRDPSFQRLLLSDVCLKTFCELEFLPDLFQILLRRGQANGQLLTIVFDALSLVLQFLQVGVELGRILNVSGVFCPATEASLIIASTSS